MKNRNSYSIATVLLVGLMSGCTGFLKSDTSVKIQNREYLILIETSYSILPEVMNDFHKILQNCDFIDLYLF